MKLQKKSPISTEERDNKNSTQPLKDVKQHKKAPDPKNKKQEEEYRRQNPNADDDQ